MYCFRCGTKVEDNQKYCPHCGADVLEELNRYNYPSSKEQEPNVKSTSHEEQYAYSIQYSFGKEEDLIEAYAGKNYNKIKSSKFSIPTFFFGSIYFFYRKLYILSLSYILISIFLSILTPLLFIIHLSLTIGFSTIYLKTVENRVKKIKQQNTNAGKDTLLEQCRKKGGTNIFGTILLIILFSLVPLIAFNIYKYNKTETIELNVEQNFTIGDITYTIPKGFEKIEYDDLSTYNLYTDTNYCSISFSINDYANFYENAKEYLNETTYTSQNDSVSPMESIIIKNKEWQHLTIEKNYETENRYAMKDSNVMYIIETNNDKEDSICNDYYQQILNSITYKEW